MGKKKKIVLISSIVVFSAAWLYFWGGPTAAMISFYCLFEARQSSIEILSNPLNQVFKTRKDFPNLSKRTEFVVFSGNNQLSTYSYEHDSPKGIVICAHGMRSLADGLDAIYQNWFYEEGYHVVSFDLSSCGASTANPHHGICQSPIDVKYVYEAVLDRYQEEKDLPLYLVGYSWGGYGVATSLEYGVSPTGIITFSAFDNPRENLFATAHDQVGFVADLTRLTFDIGVNVKYGIKGDLSAKSSILSHENVKSLHFYGDSDVDVISSVSLYEKLSNAEAPNVKTHLLKGASHLLPWVELSSVKEVENAYDAIARMNNKEEIDAYLSTIDKEKTSKFSLEVESAIRLFLNE